MSFFFSAMMSIVSSGRFFRPGQKFGEVVVDAARAEIGLPPEGGPHIPYPVGLSPRKFNEGKDKVFRLVEGIENFVPGDGDGLSAGDPPLDLKKAQPAPDRVPAFYIVAETVKFPVDGFKSEARSVSMTIARARAAAACVSAVCPSP
ncbi:hypothetical protein MASR2M17_15120 [Aminivibrio sp.]